MNKPLNIVILGLSITSSWGNGHATTYRSLVKALAARGHRVLFLERDTPWYATNRDAPQLPYCSLRLYRDLEELKLYVDAISNADLVIIGSYVPEGVEVAEIALTVNQNCVAFYDIDTPVTMTKLARKDYEYLHPRLIPRFDFYFSFTGGPLLKWIENHYGAQRARPLYCSVDPELYFPEPNTEKQYDLGYLGTYSADRQPTLEQLLIEPARNLNDKHFVVAGPQYPGSISWSGNIKRVDHIPPAHHRRFYNSQRFTLNVTRREMIKAGYSPSVRLFEAAACATPIISDDWKGLDQFFHLGEEILVAHNPQDVERYLTMPEDQRLDIGERCRKRVLSAHTSVHRAMELERYHSEVATPTLAVNA